MRQAQLSNLRDRVAVAISRLWSGESPRAVGIVAEQRELSEARVAMRTVAPRHPARRWRLLPGVVALVERARGGREIAVPHERIRLVVADERAALGARAMTDARGAVRQLVRSLRPGDALGKVPTLDADPPDRIEVPGMKASSPKAVRQRREACRILKDSLQRRDEPARRDTRQKRPTADQVTVTSIAVSGAPCTCR